MIFGKPDALKSAKFILLLAPVATSRQMHDRGLNAYKAASSSLVGSEYLDLLAIGVFWEKSIAEEHV